MQFLIYYPASLTFQDGRLFDPRAAPRSRCICGVLLVALYFLHRHASWRFKQTQLMRAFSKIWKKPLTARQSKRYTQIINTKSVQFPTVFLFHEQSFSLYSAFFSRAHGLMVKHWDPLTPQPPRRMLHTTPGRHRHRPASPSTLLSSSAPVIGGCCACGSDDDDVVFCV